MLKSIILILVLIPIIIGAKQTLVAFRPCNGTEEITGSYELGRSPEEENQYFVNINIQVPVHTKVEMRFDSEAIVMLPEVTAANGKIRTIGDNFLINFFRDADYFSISVKGPPRGTIPYLKSFIINTQEYCESPAGGVLDEYLLGYQDSAANELKAPDGCGRRKVEHVELIVNGEATKAGDWPWHAAVYRLRGSDKKYTCGGTLISKTMVLTAAHCTTLKGIPVTPEILSVVLGKYNLIGDDLECQEREVNSIIIHEDFALKNYSNNDIALLKLKSEVTYNDYVQPACIWYSGAYDRLPTKIVYGTVVGWGIHQNTLSSQLHQASMPKISDGKCIKKNPVFYGNALKNNKKFCAGWANGTSACNGDGGGGFVVFVPDTPKSDSSNAVGSWYVRGIASMSLAQRNQAICDPNQYVVYTDVANYIDWIKKHLDQ